MKMRITNRVRELLEGISAIESDEGPLLPTLYERGVPLGSSLEMPRREWVEAIGTIIFEGEASSRTIGFLLSQVNDPTFARECLVSAGELPHTAEACESK
jgi:hypothetical protein